MPDSPRVHFPMPARRGKIPHNGALRDAELVDMMETKEPWSEVSLADGSLVRSKVVVSEVWKVTGEYDPNGDPVYVVKAQIVTSTVAPEHLRKQQK